MHNISLVVITHQSAAWLAPLAQSWAASLRAAATGDCPVVIADAGSTDATLTTAREHFPAATILQLPNHGFGATANAALRQVATPWALLCNADLTFAPDFAAQATAAVSAAPEGVAAIAPQLRNADGTAQPSVGHFPSLAGILRDQFRPRPQRKYVAPQPGASGRIDWASGACLLLRCQTFQAIGGFDEKYFLYAEEVDLQRRLRDAGGTIWFDPTLQVTHHQPNAARAPRAEVQRYAARGMLRYFAKFSPAALAGYRVLALLSLRLPPHEALASRTAILRRPTGP